MTITKQEQLARGDVEFIHQSISPTPVSKTPIIRQQALEMFTKALDQKLAILNEGEQLLITYRVDIRGTDGKIYAGAKWRINLPEYKVWRNQVLKRDRYKCHKCGSKNRIQAHHIKSWAKYPEGRFDPDNGVTLCIDCHANQHPKNKAFIYASGRKKIKTKSRSS
jgi:hypothetical protein